MATTIQDGSGFGYSAKVDSTNRLEVRAVTEDSQLEGSLTGDTFAIGTPFLTQTSSSANGLLYFSNGENVDIYAKTFSSQARYATSASFENYLINVYVGIAESALTGTWVDFTPFNTNLGSSNTLAGTYKYGSPTGAAGFSGTPKFQLAFPVNVYNQISTNLVFPKGVSVLLTVTPPTNNVSMPVSFTTTVTKLTNI